MYKRILILVLIMSLLCTGCAKGEPRNAAESTGTGSTGRTYAEPKTVQDIDWYNYPYGGNKRYEKDELDSSRDARMYREDLQKAVSEIQVEYPLSTNERIQAYAWALYDIFVSQEMIDSELVPKYLKHYSDGVWQIRFLITGHITQYGSYIDEGPVYYDAEAPLAIVSEEDGHLIYFGFLN